MHVDKLTQAKMHEPEQLRVQGALSDSFELIGAI